MVARGPGTAESWMELGGRLLGKLRQHEIGHLREALQRLVEPEKQEISLRYILKYSTRGCSNIFQLVDTSERQDHFVANRKTGWRVRERTLHSKRVGKTSGMKLSIREQRRKPRRAPRGPRKRRCRSKVRIHPGRKKASGLRWTTSEGGVSLSRSWPREF